MPSEDEIRRIREQLSPELHAQLDHALEGSPEAFLLRHKAEQGRAGFAELAALFGVYFAELLKHGFRREEAVHIVVSYQDITVGRQPEAEE